MIDYRYTEESGSTAFRIAAIHYNSNPGNGVAASHQVAFTYETAEPGNRRGLRRRHAHPQIVRLDRIDVLNNGSVLRRYDLAYEPALSSGGRSRLASVKECGAGGTDCLAPTTFAWQDGMRALGRTNRRGPVPVQVILHEQGWDFADFNGEAATISCGLAVPKSRPHAPLRLGLGDGAFGAAVNSGIPRLGPRRAIRRQR